MVKSVNAEKPPRKRSGVGGRDPGDLSFPPGWTPRLEEVGEWPAALVTSVSFNDFGEEERQSRRGASGASERLPPARPQEGAELPRGTCPGGDRTVTSRLLGWCSNPPGRLTPFLAESLSFKAPPAHIPPQVTFLTPVAPAQL